VTAWQLPADPTGEKAADRQIAVWYRSEAARLLEAINQYKRAIAGLETARWHAIGKAAEIERDVRGI